MRATRTLRVTPNVNLLHLKLQSLGALAYSVVPKVPVHKPSARAGQAAAVVRCSQHKGQTAVTYDILDTVSQEDALLIPAAKRQRLQQQPFLEVSGCQGLRSEVNTVGSSRTHRQGLSILHSTRISQLEKLQSFLGYQFRDLRLLDQACTHDSSGSVPSYRELAFVGDAALWLLFAEHAFRTYAAQEDPIRGAWPSLLSKLLSRANCAATARQWGLDAFLQHGTMLRTSRLTDPVAQQQQQQQEWSHLLPLQPDNCSWQLEEGQCSHRSPQHHLTKQTYLEANCSSSSSILDRSDSLRSTSSMVSISSSGGSSSGMYAGVWTSDTLAEMFEGVVGALLLDCGEDFEALKQLLLPWAASSFDAAKAAAAAAAAPALVPSPTPSVTAAEGVLFAAWPAWLSTADGQPPAQSQAVWQQQAVAVSAPGCTPSEAHACQHTKAVEGPHATAHGAPGQQQQQQQQVALEQQQQQQRELHQLQVALEQQLQQLCSCSVSPGPALAAASRHMQQLMQQGLCCSEAETLRFLGFGVVQFAAALQAYRLQHPAQEGRTLWPAQLRQLHQQGGSQSSATTSSSSSSSSSSNGAEGHVQLGVGRRDKVVHQMASHASELTTVRHRAKMWLLLMEGTPWWPADSYLVKSSWKKQKQMLSRCLDLLLAAVYLDNGLESAVGVSLLLIHTTPPTTHDKSWMPVWARKK